MYAIINSSIGWLADHKFLCIETQKYFTKTKIILLFLLKIGVSHIVLEESK